MGGNRRSSKVAGAARSDSGVRLMCSRDLLRDILITKDMELLVIVKLQRYEKGFGGKDSRFSHTVSVVRINKALDFEYYKGAVNKVHQMRY